MSNVNYTDTTISLAEIVDNTGQVPGLPSNPAYVTQARYEACRDVLAKSDDTMLQLRQVVVYPFQGKFVIISGHTRVRACRELGKDSIPVRVLDENTPSEYLAELAIKSNVDYGEFDIKALQTDFDMRTILDCGIEPDLFTFEFDEVESGSLDDMLDDEPDVPETDSDEVQDDEPIDRTALPEELQNIDLEPEPLDRIEGDDERLNERVVIMYRPEQEQLLESIIGAKIDKVVFHITELSEPVQYMEFDNE